MGDASVPVYIDGLHVHPDASELDQRLGRGCKGLDHILLTALGGLKGHRYNRRGMQNQVLDRQ